MRGSMIDLNAYLQKKKNILSQKKTLIKRASTVSMDGSMYIDKMKVNIKLLPYPAYIRAQLFKALLAEQSH